MSERNIARDISNELLIWGTADIINNYFKEKKINNYKDWWFRKLKELERRLSEEQKQRLLDFFKDEQTTSFVYRAKSLNDFESRYEEATGRKMSMDGLTGNDLFYSKSSNYDDNGNVGWTILGFFIPYVGLILYLIWKNSRPNDSKAAGKGALATLILGILGILLTSLSN
jgi:hypothetical protein